MAEERVKPVILDTSDTLEALDMIEIVEANRLGAAKRICRGKVLFWQNDPVDRLFLVKTGKVKTCILSEDGKSRTYGIWGRGTTLGITAHFLGENHLVTAHVLQTADVLIVSPSDLDSLVESEVTCSLAVIRYLARFVKIFLREVDALSFLDVQERLKRSLESLAFHHGHVTPNGIQIDLAVTHEEIAELTAANRTTITAYLNDLKRQGYLWSSGRHLIIVPRDHIRILENLSEAVVAADIDDAKRWTRRAIHEKIDLVKLLDVLARAIPEVEAGEVSYIGEQSDVGEATAVAREVLEILLAEYAAGRPRQSPLGSVVIGTAQGDTHDLGKLMASILLVRAGFRIIDLGVDVGWEQFAAAVQEHRATVLAVSSAITVDCQQQESAREVLRDSGLLEQVTLVVGGVGFSKENAVRLGAAGYAGSVLDTVRLVKFLSKRKQQPELSSGQQT